MINLIAIIIAGSIGLVYLTMFLYATYGMTIASIGMVCGFIVLDLLLRSLAK